MTRKTFLVLPILLGAAWLASSSLLASRAEAKVQQKRIQKVAWRISLPAALQEAKRTGKPVLVDFHAEWCGPCKMMDLYTYTDAGVIAATKSFITVKIDADRNPALLQKYGVPGLPGVVFLKPNGQMYNRFLGFRNAQQLKSILAQAKKQAKKS